VFRFPVQHMNHTFLQLYFMFLIIADVYLSPINDYGLELWHMCHHLYTTELIWSIFVSGSIYRFMFLLLKRMIFNVTILLYDSLFQSLLYLTKCGNTGRGCRALDYKRRWEAYLTACASVISMHKVFIIQYQMLRNLEADKRTSDGRSG
jgi:hypothetical protein